MKTYGLVLSLLIASLLIAVPNVALADYFQIFDSTHNSYLPYTRITVNGQLVGTTDGYGRIKIDLPHGSYQGEVTARDGTKRIAFSIDDAAVLKKLQTQ